MAGLARCAALLHPRPAEPFLSCWIASWPSAGLLLRGARACKTHALSLACSRASPPVIDTRHMQGPPGCWPLHPAQGLLLTRTSRSFIGVCAVTSSTRLRLVATLQLFPTSSGRE